VNRNTNTELGVDSVPQLFNLEQDLEETKNLAAVNASKLKELSDLLAEIRERGRSRP